MLNKLKKVLTVLIDLLLIVRAKGWADKKPGVDEVFRRELDDR